MCVNIDKCDSGMLRIGLTVEWNENNRTKKTAVSYQQKIYLKTENYV